MSVEGLNSSPMTEVVGPPPPPARAAWALAPSMVRPVVVQPPLRLWTAPAIGIVSFLFGFPAGIALAARNWYRLGRPHEAYAHVLAGIAVFVAAFLVPDANSVLVGVINVAIAVYLVVRTRRDARRLELEGRMYELAGAWSGIVTAVAGWLVTLGAAVVVVSVLDVALGTALG